MGLFNEFSFDGIETEEVDYLKKTMDILVEERDMVITEELAEKLGKHLNNYATYKFCRLLKIGKGLDENNRMKLYTKLKEYAKGIN